MNFFFFNSQSHGSGCDYVITEITGPYLKAAISLSLAHAGPRQNRQLAASPHQKILATVPFSSTAGGKP